MRFHHALGNATTKHTISFVSNAIDGVIGYKDEPGCPVIVFLPADKHNYMFEFVSCCPEWGPPGDTVAKVRADVTEAETTINVLDLLMSWYDLVQANGDIAIFLYPLHVQTMRCKLQLLSLAENHHAPTLVSASLPRAKHTA